MKNLRRKKDLYSENCKTLIEKKSNRRHDDEILWWGLKKWMLKLNSFLSCKPSGFNSFVYDYLNHVHDFGIN